jgi:hypothetical protein
MLSNIDTNVKNYSIAELMAITEVNDLEPDEIREKTNERIKQLKVSNPVLSVFFLEIQSQLLQYASSLQEEQEEQEEQEGTTMGEEGFQSMSEATYPAGEKQISNWFENEALPQENNSVQKDKTTERKQKIDVFGNNHAPMNREQLGVNNNFQVSVAQDSLNPNLKNTITRFVNLDSQFRQYSSGFETTSTDYTLDLSDPLNNALNMRLYSYQVPYSFYTIDTAYGNTCFWITDASNNEIIPISVASGNYTPSQFVTTLNKSFQDLGFTFPTTPANSPVSYNENNGKITLTLSGGVYPGGTIIIDGQPRTFAAFNIESSPDPKTTIITFFDHTSRLQCETNCVNKSFYLNQTLGWIMGFRVPFIAVLQGGNVAPSVLDLTGTKYLILVIDDYNQNHVNNGLVSIAEYSNKLKLPSYYSPDLPYTCVLPSSNAVAISASNDLFLSGKLDVEYSKTQILLPSAPRTLTNPQLYTINEITKNRNNNTNYRAKAPTSTDILAMIPIKTSGSSTGTLLVEFSGSLQDNIRTYFGPVNIERMRVKLLNDKGNVVNLNGVDWCVTLICDCLYQY